MFAYHIPPGVQPASLGARPLLSTSGGGQIALDARLLALWQFAAGRTLADILTAFPEAHAAPEGPPSPNIIRAALACLAEAGLLERRPRPNDRYPSGDQPGSDDWPCSGDRPVAPTVSTIIVDYNSLGWLKECLPSLAAQTHARLEIIVVDNGSAESPLPWLGEHFPAVKTLRLDRPVGLAAALNRGAALATGDHLLFLNPDVRLERDAVAQMFAVAQSDPRCAAVAPRLEYWWAPGFLNGLGNRVGAVGWGADNAQGHLDLGQFADWREVPSACFAAALLPRLAWESVGALDKSYPMYYEDSDWCYRARLLGYTVRAAPQAVAYHAFGRRVHTGQDVDLSPSKLRNVVYGRLRFALKILSPLMAARFLLGYGLEDTARLLVNLLRGRWPEARAVLAGWQKCFADRAEIRSQRRALQSRRVRSDRDLLAPPTAQRQVPPPLIWRGLPELTWDLVCHHYLPLIETGKTRPMPEFSASRPRLLIISHDIVDAKLAGPGMRYLEMARALGNDLDVTLAVPSQTSLKLPGAHLAPYDPIHPGDLKTLVAASEVVLISSFVLAKFPFIERVSQRVVVDLYDPFLLENLHYYQAEPMEAQQSINARAVDILNRLAARGDYFICGSERQRDFWMGVLAAGGRVTPQAFAQDPSLRALIDVVGIGFPDREPRPRPLLRGVHPDFPPESRIVLWGGGVWDWLDPLSLVRAWPQVLAQHPGARLVFLGTRHPNPLVPRHKIVDQVEALAGEIGEKDRTIFFIEWLPYNEREGLLCEADVGVALHPVHVETRYSIRTRVLDYLWARLPALVTEGDVTSEWVQRYELGRVVPPLDADAVARALCELLARPKRDWAPAFDPLRDVFAWPHVAAPLREYCLHGLPAADRGARRPAIGSTGTGALLARARYIQRHEGWRVLLHRIGRYVQWRLSR